MIDQNQYSEFFHDFLVESTELLQVYESNLLEIESVLKSPSFVFDDIEEGIQAIFRCIHTIKGLAAMMDFHEVKDYTHDAEDILDLARSNQIAFDDTLIDVMFDILDTVKKQIQNVVTPGSNSFNLEDEIAKLQLFLDTSVSVDLSEETPQISDGDTFDEVSAVKEKEGKTPEAEEHSFERHPAGRHPAGGQPKLRHPAFSNTIRVDTRRLDELLNTVGELVIGKNRLMDISKTYTGQNGGTSNGNGKSKHTAGSAATNGMKSDLEETVDGVTRLIVNLQESTMKLRMVPIGSTFKKFRRLVRDLAKKNKKEVQLEIEGEKTEVDRVVIESMKDPLLHIIRNAIDHGIEAPNKRKKQGKAKSGKLHLSAFQENNMIVIHIEDDGQGIDAEKIYHSAIDKGFIEPTAQLSKKEKLNLIFLPGFSTAKQVTEVSGRGVGMDVVKKNILKLNGLIDIESEVGVGTKIILKLPLTLAIIQVLLVDIGHKRYSLPITNVIETLRVPTSEIQYINGHEAVQIRGSVLPIIRLNESLNLELSDDEENIFVVVVGIAEKRVGFVVDAMRGQQDIVIKPLGNYLKHLHGISGATVLGNGDISLVLDVASLWDEQTSIITKEEEFIL